MADDFFTRLVVVPSGVVNSFRWKIGDIVFISGTLQKVYKSSNWKGWIEQSFPTPYPPAIVTGYKYLSRKWHLDINLDGAAEIDKREKPELVVCVKLGYTNREEYVLPSQIFKEHLYSNPDIPFRFSRKSYREVN